MKKKYSKFVIPTPKMQADLEKCGYDIGPNKAIDVCKIIRITMDNFYKLFHKDEFEIVRACVFQGEKDRYKKEEQHYHQYKMAFLTDVPIKKKYRNEVQSMEVSFQQMGVIKSDFMDFKKAYKDYALSEKYERRLESQIDIGIKLDGYEAVRQAIIMSQDLRAGVQGRLSGDYSYTPEHYLIETDKVSEKIKPKIKPVRLLSKKEKVIIIDPKESKKPAKKPAFILDDD